MLGRRDVGIVGYHRLHRQHHFQAVDDCDAIVGVLQEVVDDVLDGEVYLEFISGGCHDDGLSVGHALLHRLIDFEREDVVADDLGCGAQIGLLGVDDGVVAGGGLGVLAVVGGEFGHGEVHHASAAITVGDEHAREILCESRRCVEHLGRGLVGGVDALCQRGGHGHGDLAIVGLGGGVVDARRCAQRVGRASQQVGRVVVGGGVEVAVDGAGQRLAQSVHVESHGSQRVASEAARDGHAQLQAAGVNHVETSVNGVDAQGWHELCDHLRLKRAISVGLDASHEFGTGARLQARIGDRVSRHGERRVHDDGALGVGNR